MEYLNNKKLIGLPDPQTAIFYAPGQFYSSGYRLLPRLKKHIPSFRPLAAESLETFNAVGVQPTALNVSNSWQCRTLSTL